MAWTDAPPSKAELSAAPQAPASNWASAPPTKEELSNIPEQSFTQKHAGAIQGALDSLPTAGLLAGGAVGGLSAGPVGGVAGAGLGSAGGAALKNLGEQYILGKDKTREDIYGEPLKEGLLGAGAEAGGQVIGPVAKAISESPVGRYAGKAVDATGRGLAKFGEAISGVPEKEITTYAKNADEIKNAYNANDKSLSKAADTVREKFKTDIETTKSKLNEQIASALKGNENTIQGQPILDKIESFSSRVNKKLNPEDLQKLNELKKKVQSVVGEDGLINVNDAHDLKKTLQDMGSGAYNQAGAIFNRGDIGSQAAKAGGAVTRENLYSAVPDLKEPYGKLSQLRDLQKNMNKNLIAPKKAEAGLLAAGSGSNPRNVENLEKLGELTGTNMTGEADKLAAMREFADPRFLANATTGKALLHHGAGGLVGGLAGREEGIGFWPGAIAGAALSSPAAVKAAINSGLLTKKLGAEIIDNPALLKNKALQNILTKGLLSPQ